MQDGGQESGRHQHGGTQNRHPIHGQHTHIQAQRRQVPHLGEQNHRHQRHTPGHITLQRAILQPPGNRTGQPAQLLNAPFEHQLGVHLRQARVQIKQAAPLGINKDATKQGNKAHHQRQVKAMPDGQVILRQLAPQGSGGRHRQQPGHGDRREHPHRHTQRHQNLHRHLHIARRFMGRVFGQIDGLTVEEHVVNKARRIGHREHPAQGRTQGQQPAQGPQLFRLQGLGKEHLLGQETVQQRHPRHGRRRHHGQHRRIGHVLPQAVDTAHVAGAGLVINDPRGHEKAGLEGGMVNDMEHRRHGRQLAVQAEQQRDQAQMANGGIRQQAF